MPGTSGPSRPHSVVLGVRQLQSLGLKEGRKRLSPVYTPTACCLSLVPKHCPSSEYFVFSLELQSENWVSLFLGQIVSVLTGFTLVCGRLEILLRVWISL